MRSADNACSKRTINRRKFLKLGGTGLVGAALIGAGSVGAFAQDEASESSSLLEEFEEASSRHDVPVELLLAMGYVNTRLEMPPPEESAYEPGNPHGRGAYGIMQLVENDSADTLGEASRLTGLSKEDLKTDRAANILGGAALLAESQGEKPARLGDYFGAVSGKGGNGKPYEAVAGVGAGDKYARQVFRALRRGFSVTTGDGERIDLPALDEGEEL